MDFDLAVNLRSSSADPIYLRVAQALAADIRTGRLPAGASLPGTRRLARILAVHRNTVLAAYRELEAQGLVSTEPSRGTFVSPGAAHREPAARDDLRRAVPSGAGFPLRQAAGPRPEAARRTAGLLEFSHMPDPALAPSVALARAYRRALRGTDVLHYARDWRDGAAFGHPRLREAVAAMLTRTRGLGATARDVLITNGSQMALYLAARALVEPGDVIAVEALGYRPIWEAFRRAGARLEPVAVDEHGMQVEALRALSARMPIRAVFVTPHHQHPTGASLSPARRAALLELSHHNRIAIIEDDYDPEFHYGGPAVLPVASHDRGGSVIYVGTLSKMIAPGVRVGYAVAPRPVLELMAEHRTLVDRQGDHVLGGAIAEMLEDGELQRHLRRVREVYRARRDTLVEALTRSLGAAVRFRVPQRGTALWVGAAEGIDMDRWHAAAVQRGVTFSPGRSFLFEDGPHPFARLGYAGLSESQLREAVGRLALALRDIVPNLVGR